MKMIVSNRLRGVIALFMCLLLQPAPELWAHTKKGDKLLKLGEKAEANKEYEKALEYYTQALESDPEDPGYQLHARQMRFQASQLHVTAGQKLRNAGRLQDALVEFDHAYATDPSSAVAIQEIQRTTQMIERNRNENLTGEDAKLTPVELARQKQLQRIDSLEPAPELKPITNQISTLKMNNQPPRVLYETVGKLAGINVIFDPQYQTAGKNVNLDLTNTTLEQALDYIATLTKTFWKPISSNTIFVAEDSVTKRRDYQDEEVKVFYLKNVTSAQEFQEIITAVRSITDIRRMFSYAPLNAVICRASVDQMALAAKLFHDLDKPKAEVVIDVMVMSVNTDRTRNLAMGLVSGGTTGLVLPIGFAPRGATTTTPSTGTTGTDNNGGTTGTGITGVTGVTGGTTTAPAGTISLGQLGKLGFSDFNVTLPGALLQAVATDNQTRVLQSPELRASDGQKATLKIGQRIPYATGSYQPGIGTVGVSPLVSTQFNFADTGVNVELTPHVHGTDELTLHVVVDLSSVATYANIGGIQQPVIAQQKNEAEIRLRDGEVSLLGGLSQDQNTNNLSGLPGIVNIPVLGGLLFGSQTKERTRQELLIALVPHIVRTPDVDAVDLRGVASGTDQEVKVSFQEAPPAPAQAPAAPVVPAPAAAPPNGAAALSFAPGAIQIPLSGQATVTIEARNMTDLSAAPLHLKWDPKLLRLNSVTPGALIGDGGPQANPPSIDIRNDTGEASITLTRAAGAPGVNGSGGLAVLQFTAIGKGTGTVAMTGAALKNSKQQAIPVSPPLLAVTVQ